MLMQLLTAYLWVALFTAVSIVMEWPFTGTKLDYQLIRYKLKTAFPDKPGWYYATYLWVLLVGTFLWPCVYYYRLKDVLR